MKKRLRLVMQRRFRRVGALLSALVICALLVVPCSASNNASTKKWVVVSSAQLFNESGTRSTYFELTPYENGVIYRYIFASYLVPVQSTVVSSYYDYWIIPINYPDWWRADIPLGAEAYIEIQDVADIDIQLHDSTGYPDVTDTSLDFYLLNSSYSFRANDSYSSSAFALSSEFVGFPVAYTADNESFDGSSNHQVLYTSSIPIPKGVTSAGPTSFSGFNQIVYSPLNCDPKYGAMNSFGLNAVPVFYNFSSNDLVFAVAPSSFNVTKKPVRAYCSCTAKISFWVGADKLPAGLQVGDEFPADTDAFDQLRDDLIAQFPAVSGHIEDDKSMWEGWTDGATVDQTAASTGLQAINATIGSLGQVVAVLSLAAFGAVVLRILLRKAVS